MRFIGLLLHTRVLGAGVPPVPPLTTLLLPKILILAAVARMVAGGGRGEG